MTVTVQDILQLLRDERDSWVQAQREIETQITTAKIAGRIKVEQCLRRALTHANCMDIFTSGLLEDAEALVGGTDVIPDPNCNCVTGTEEWSGSPSDHDPDNTWTCDDCGRHVAAGEYEVFKSYRDPSKETEVIHSGLSKDAAMAFVNGPDTSGDGWFMGFRRAD